MGAAQRSRSSRPARLGKAALLGLCVLGAVVAPASAAESYPPAEPAPQSAPSGAGGKVPTPDAPPQSAAPARAPAAPSRSPAAPEPTEPSALLPASPTPHSSPPRPPAARRP